MRQHERDEYMERKKEKEAREEQLRKAFLKMSAQKKSMARRKNDMQETVEVVDETETEEEDQLSAARRTHWAVSPEKILSPSNCITIYVISPIQFFTFIGR